MENRKLNRRDFLRLSAAAATGAMVAACAPATPEVVVVEKEIPVEKEVVKTVVVEKEVEKVVEKVVTPTPAPAGPVTLRLQRWMGECPEVEGITELGKAVGACPIFQVLTNKWNADHPDMQIETLVVDWPGYDKLNAQYAAGDPPDMCIMHGHWVPNYASRGLLVPLDDTFEAAGIDVNDFLDTAREYATYEGKFVALPFDIHGGLWHLNVAVWREAGLVDSDGNPQIPTSTTDFMAAAEQVKAKTDKTFLNVWLAGASGTVWPWLAFVHQQGGSPVSADVTEATVDTPQGLAALEFMYSWMEGDYIPPPGIDSWGLTERFLNGQDAGWIQGTWWVDRTDQQVKEGAELQEYMVVNFPQLFDKPGSWSGSHCWVVPSRTHPDPAKMEAAGKFFKYLYDNNLEWARVGHLSVRKSVIDSPEYRGLPHRGEYADFAKTAFPWPRGQFIGALETIIQEEIQAVWIGEKTPKEALAQAQRRLDDFLKYAI